MKKILTFLFGDLGLFVSATIMTVASWFLFPLFVDIVRGGHSLSNLIGYIFICPIAILFFISSISSAITLITKGCRAKNWLLVGLGTVVLIFDIVILIIGLV